MSMLQEVPQAHSYQGRKKLHILISLTVCADVTPIFFMWEKLIGTHEKPSWIRLPSRLPVGQPLSSAPSFGLPLGGMH